MPRGDKSKYKQECKADHIAGRSRGVAQAESEADRGTVNKDDGAAIKSGSGRGKSVARSFESKSATAKKTASARRRHAAEAAHS
jgi:hypothetical protein